eukprot:3415802-Amphidinium_carterae.1
MLLKKGDAKFWGLQLTFRLLCLASGGPAKCPMFKGPRLVDTLNVRQHVDPCSPFSSKKPQWQVCVGNRPSMPPRGTRPLVDHTQSHMLQPTSTSQSTRQAAILDCT